MVSFTSLQWFVKSVIKPVIVDIWLNIGILEKLTYHLLLFEISCCKLFVIHFIKFFGESFLLRYSGTNRPGTGFTTTNRRHSAFSHAVSTLPFKIFNLFSLLSLKEATLLKKIWTIIFASLFSNIPYRNFRKYNGRMLRYTGS